MTTWATSPACDGDRSGVDMSQLVLRDYQVNSVEGLRDGFRAKHTRQVLTLPTGGGKSRVMEHMIHGVQAKGTRIMFVCERRVLVEQFSKHLDRAGIDHGVLMAKHWRFRPQCQVQIASVQTLERMKTLPKVDLIFIDEVHACMRQFVINLMLAQPDLRIIGATATPFHPALGRHFTNVVSTITMSRLVDEGHLVPFRVFVAREVSTEGLKVVAGEWKKDDLEQRGRQIVGDVVADYVRISHEVFGEYRKTICFSCGVEHGAELAQRFIDAGVNAVQISSEDAEEFRDQVLEEFARPDTDLKVVISVAILSQGFDQTDVEHVILARPLKKSFSEHVQMVGRGARPHAGKQFCVIQDHSGNWLRFQEDWEKLFNDGVESLGPGTDTKPRKEPTPKEKEAAKCPKCSAFWPPKTDTCSNCGHVRTKHNAVETVAGEVVEVGASKKPKAEKFSAEYKRDFYAQLLGNALQRGHNPGSAYHRYVEKFGVGPSGPKPEPAPVGEEVRRWLVSRNIRNAADRKRVAA
ncbi:DEAD/DEAH box helicase [Delftia tsuruhatensis]|nr:DEAD/DEAH box helicase family protein [Delftia tsuruhatensis]